MVFYFYPVGYVEGKQDFLIYMGKDKYENEELIKYGLPLDVWFHVDDMSSAHVYLRLPENCGLDEIPEKTLEECAQLVKQNSIQGCKVNNVTIVYTPWSNLKKTNGMEVGQVGFHNPSMVRKTKIERKNNEIINRLERTKKESYPDLRAEKDAYDSQQRSAKRAEERAQRVAEKAAKEEQRRVDDLRTYKSLMKEENMVNSKELATKYQSVEDYEDDFM